MPFFGKKDNLYTCSLQCGAGRDAYLQVELSELEVGEIEVFTLPPLKKGLSDGVEPSRLVAAVKEALAKTNEHFGSKYFIAKIGYIPNDSTHYDLHGRLVFEIIRHLRDGGKFKPLASNT